jgi:hypothetical protein
MRLIFSCGYSSRMLTCRRQLLQECGRNSGIIGSSRAKAASLRLVNALGPALFSLTGHDQHVSGFEAENGGGVPLAEWVIPGLFGNHIIPRIPLGLFGQ